MRRKKKDDVNFEINLTKAKWEPKTIAEIPTVVSRSFETELSLQDISPIEGTDHVKTWPMNEDSDIPVFIKEKSMLNEAFAEKVIRFQLPKGVMPKKWEPKKVKILAKGDRLAKYFGEDQCGEREVQISLKLFECGHFYLKLTLPGSGISPHWTIFEGTWEHTERGLKLVILIRYSWQICRKPEMDLNIEAVPDAGWTTTLAWAGESETQLNGNIPAVVGTDRWCWVEIYRDADKQEKVAARFNEDMDDDASWKDSTWKDSLKPKRDAKASSSGSPNADVPETVMKSSELAGDTALHQRPAASSSASEQSRPTASSGSSGSPAAMRSAQAEESGEEESALPLYIGVAIFVLVVCYFGWLKLRETLASWAVNREASELW